MCKRSKAAQAAETGRSEHGVYLSCSRQGVWPPGGAGDASLVEGAPTVRLRSKRSLSWAWDVLDGGELARRGAKSVAVEDGQGCGRVSMAEYLRRWILCSGARESVSVPVNRCRSVVDIP